VQPFKERNQPATVEKLYFDFDSRDLRLAWREAVKFAAYIREFYNAEPLICFSGNKGYNVYVWLQNPVQLSSQKLKIFYKTAQKMLLKGLKIETLDPQPVGDVKRFSRVPYSIHQKTRNPCVPVTINHNPTLISNVNAYREHGLTNQFTNLCLKHLENQSTFKRLKIIKNNEGRIRPCIKAALQQTLKRKSGHLMRLAIAREFLAANYPTNEIVQLFRNQPDYNPEKTRYYIEYAQKNWAKPFKCRTIRELGFCLPDCRRRE
jgi:hypothetical protein